MGDNRRFDLFAKLSSEYLNKDMYIADIASGKGYLQLALRQQGFTNIVSWDKRNRNINNKKSHRYDYFNWKTNEKYDAIVGMHPDEATDHIILYAGKHQVPALITPCCALGEALSYWGPNKRDYWFSYLENLIKKVGLSLQKRRLKMNGKNLVFICRPRGVIY